MSNEWMPGTDIEFCMRLRDARHRSGKSQTTVAAEVGVWANTLLSWEKGYSRPHPSRLPKLASALGVTENFLKTGADDNEPHTEPPQPDSPKFASLSSDIESLRQKMAAAVGTSPSLVRLKFEFLVDPTLVVDA